MKAIEVTADAIQVENIKAERMTEGLHRIELKPSSLLFGANGNGEEIIRIEYNGDFYYRGKLIDNDKQVVDAFRDFLSTKGLL